MGHYRSISDNEVVQAYDVVVKAGVSFETSKQVINKLKEILENTSKYSYSDFSHKNLEFICCMPNGYGNGHYTVKGLKETMGYSSVGCVLRLLPSGFDPKKSKSLSSYSSPLPLP